MLQRFDVSTLKRFQRFNVGESKSSLGSPRRSKRSALRRAPVSLPRRQVPPMAQREEAGLAERHVPRRRLRPRAIHSPSLPFRCWSSSPSSCWRWRRLMVRVEIPISMHGDPFPFPGVRALRHRSQLLRSLTNSKLQRFTRVVDGLEVERLRSISRD